MESKINTYPKKHYIAYSSLFVDFRNVQPRTAKRQIVKNRRCIKQNSAFIISYKALKKRKHLTYFVNKRNEPHLERLHNKKQKTMVCYINYYDESRV